MSQLSVEARNARLEAIKTILLATGAPVLRIFTGAAPLNCAAANAGTELANGNLPAAPFGAAASGQMARSGTWTLQGVADGDITGGGHFRMYKSDGTTCVWQGSAGFGSGELSLTKATIETGQPVTVSVFVATDPEA